MDLEQGLVDQMMQHAREEAPREACGLLVESDGVRTYHRCRNISAEVGEFHIHPVDQIRAARSGKTVAVVHSHPRSDPGASMADLVAIESSDVPWIIVSPHLNEYRVHEACGIETPLAGRPFVYGLTDCASLVVDYYRTNLGIVIPPFKHQFGWWDKGLDLYRTVPPTLGFVRVTGQPLQKYDLLVLMLENHPVPTHAGIYFPPEDGKPARILHHLRGRVPRMDTFGGYWQKAHVETFRHPEASRCS
jgi:proteasome lid subunit RPN8/RPN11